MRPPTTDDEKHPNTVTARLRHQSVQHCCCLRAGLAVQIDLPAWREAPPGQISNYSVGSTDGLAPTPSILDALHEGSGPRRHSHFLLHLRGWSCAARDRRARRERSHVRQQVLQGRTAGSSRLVPARSHEFGCAQYRAAGRRRAPPPTFAAGRSPRRPLTIAREAAAPEDGLAHANNPNDSRPFGGALQKMRHAPSNKTAPSTLSS